MRFVVWLLIASVATACSDGQAPSSESYSLEQKVAIVNAGNFVSEEDISVKRIRFLLGSLQSATGYPQDKIADQAMATHNIIRAKFGREISILQLLEAANGAEAVRSKSVKLEEYWALYATLASQES